MGHQANRKLSKEIRHECCKRDLYKSHVPQPVRQAFGLCTGSICANRRNRSIFLGNLDETISELLGRPPPREERTLSGDLARLHAILLCQIMRLFQGSVKERAIVEQQQSLMEIRGMQLLQYVQPEPSLPRLIMWET